MIAQLLVVFIRLYQRTVSPRLGHRCQFRPTCSQVAISELTAHGLPGLRTALTQLRDCTGEYSLQTGPGGRLEMITRSGRHIAEEHIAQHIVERYRSFSVSFASVSGANARPEWGGGPEIAKVDHTVSRNP